jgi:DNA-binding MurR/RpiR family transcriptional regulator
MPDTKDLGQRIEASFGDMSKGQKRIADFILKNYDKAAYMTALRLGDSVGVSESTVVRFAMDLGYPGYPQLQKALQDMVRNRLTTLQRMEMTSDMSRSMVLRTVLRADMNNLRQTIESIDAEEFEQVVDLVYNSRRVYLLGARSSAPLAQFMGYYLNFLLDNVQIVTSGINDIMEQLVHIDSNDVLIGISFPRYSKRTIEGVKFAKEKGAKIVAITDSGASPLNEYTNHVLVAHSNIASFVDSLVAPFSIANAFIVAIGLQKRHEASENFMELERIWDEYNVYIEKNR